MLCILCRTENYIKGHQSDINHMTRITSRFSRILEREPAFSLWLNVREIGQGAGGEAQFLKVRWLGFAAWHMTPAHLIPSLESITTQRSPSETTRDNKPPVPDCCSSYLRLETDRGDTNKLPFLKHGEYPPHILYVDTRTTHRQPFTYRRRR